MAFTLRLLGAAQARLDGAWHGLRGNQVLLLGAYLAVRDDRVGRDELLALFWPDAAEKDARRSLRQLLHQARNADWLAGLEADPAALRWPVESDVGLFREALAGGDWAAACALYGGDLLPGAFRAASAPYEEWLGLERDALQAAWRGAALSHAATLEARGAFAEAADLLQDVLKRDPLAEDALQAYLRAARGAGRRAEAIRAFEAFEVLLRSELGMPPLDDTARLAEAIRTSAGETPPAPADGPPRGGGAFEPPPPEGPGAAPVQTLRKPSEAPRLRNLPTQLTPFVGREVDLAEIAGFLQGGDSRLLTLVGPGGVGKTRLALQTVAEQGERFADGAAFVPLAAVAAAGAVVQEIAESLGFAFAAKGDPEEQLLDYLRAKEVLLVLDNFEHLLEASDIVSAVLEASPRSRVLVTTRAALGLPGETLYEVRGLAVPASEGDEHADLYDAVRLFARTARRVQPRFTLDGHHRALTARVCRLLGGVPLALELAAGWLRLLTLEEVAAELENSLDLLESEGRGVPERHRSMRAAFEHSWALLDEQEREALLKLSAFRGGFRKEASDAVTGTPLRVLLALVNKSMIYRTPSGRFERHPLIFEFCRERFARQEYAHEVQGRHAQYFLALAEEAATRLHGPEQKRWLERLDEEHDNLQAALEWSSAQGDVALGLEIAVALGWYWAARGHFELGRAWLERLRGRLPPEHKGLWGEALRGEAKLRFWQGHLDEAAELLEEGLQQARDLGDKRGIADALHYLGRVAFPRGNYGEARALLEESLALSRGLGDRHAEASTLGALGELAQFLADLDEAEGFYRKMLELSRELGDPLGVAKSLNYLGDLARIRGDLPGSKALVEEALALSREVGDRGSVAASLGILAMIEAMLANNHEAIRLFKETLEIARDLGDQHSVAVELYNIGFCALEFDDPDTAQEHFAESLTVSRAIGDQLLVAACTSYLGVLARERGDHVVAGGLLAEGLTRFQNLGAKGEITDMLTHTAVLLATTARHEPGARLLAAAEALRGQIGVPFGTMTAETVRDWTERLRETLGDEAFDRAYKAGEALSQDEATDLALAELDAVAP